MEQEQKQNSANLEKLREIFLQPGQEPDSIKLSLEALDSPNWEKYEGAGGSDDLKEWVQKLLDGEEGAFSECCQNISHQMSFYSGIYLVFPYLVEKLAEDFDQMDTGEQIMNISELGACLSTDFSLNREGRRTPDESVMENYQLSIRKFQLVIKKFLAKKAKSLSRVDSRTKTWFAMEVLAAFGNREDAWLFEDAEAGECIYVACDGCEHCNEDLELTSKRALSAITPRAQAEDNWNGEDFEDTYLWFGDFLELVGIKGLAKHLPYYFGTYKCPECGKETVVRDLMENYSFME